MIRTLLAAALLLLSPLAASADDTLSWARSQPQPMRTVLLRIAKDPAFVQTLGQCPGALYRASTTRYRSDKSCARKPNACLNKCLKGDQSSCFNLANAMQTAAPIEEESQFAYPLYARACALGNANACVNAAATARNGDWRAGTRPSRATAPACQLKTYTEACANGAAWGCFMEGNIYRDGAPGTRPSKARADALYTRACALAPRSGACKSAYR
ncbi:hypothetical protein KUV47_19260 [Vannielia litorea]|uniref:hypothetical protein n=1 Tax=Vannielia litorea TaxID=1217970 RepID=UPI001C968A21|nr:hypothetical protein [Vannielia litorea]MBY6155371.1 hypothetical protein [Vannielia litorea]